MMKKRKWPLLILIACLCLGILFLVGCDDLPSGEELPDTDNPPATDTAPDVEDTPNDPGATPHIHTPVEHEAQEPTCEGYGWAAYTTCAECDEYSTFAVIPALGHDYSAAYQPNGEVHSVSCSRCANDVSKAHEWQLGKLVAPTCTTSGSQTYICSTCGAEKSEIISLLGHNYSDTYQPDGDVHVLTCTACSYTVAAHPHVWQSLEITLAPTCTQLGSETLICSVCTAKSTGTIDALGHNFDSNYEADGDSHSLKCSRCSVVAFSAPHSFEYLGYAQAPTCTESGVDLYECVVCGTEKTDVAPAFGHSLTNKFTVAEQTHTQVCYVCKASVSAPHSWAPGADIVEPTCTVDGAQPYACIDCGAEKSEPIAMLGHDYSYDYQPDGEVHAITCTRCSHTTAPHPHVWQSVCTITAPGCTKEGVEEIICTICSTKSKRPLDPIGHDFSGDYVADGDAHRITCSRCDATGELDAHVWASLGYSKTPTCFVTGTEEYECSLCKATKSVTVPYAHAECEWIVITEPTALVAGTKALRCRSCYQELELDRIPADVESMPAIYLEGEYQNATNDKNEVEMAVTYIDPNGDDFQAYATIKVQGSSSTAYDKKNYTIKFFKDDSFGKKLKVDFGWGKESKYVMKANWVDFSQARNVVSCRLWGDLVNSRRTSELQQKLACLSTNGGAIDGYPIAVFMNGEFHGLYTMNVPKDEWMLGMGDSETEALIAADDWNSTNFSVLLDGFVTNSEGDLVTKNGGWELRYFGTEESTGDHQWVTDSFNALISFCQNNDGEAFRAGIGQHLDVDSAIDYVIFMYANYMRDNASKNMLWATYDGSVWFPTVYDQDGTFGQVWDGVRVANANTHLPYVKNGVVDVNITYGSTVPKYILWERILNCFTEEVLLRYQELRASVLSVDNMIAELQAFETAIPESMYEADRIRWEAERNAWWASKGGSGIWYEKYHFDYMYQWIEDRMAYFDDAMRDIYNNAYLPKTSNPAI